MTTTPITTAALSAGRTRLDAIRAAGYSASGDVGYLLAELDRALAEIDRLRAERHTTNDALAELTEARCTETDVLRVEIASAQTQWEHWAREAEALAAELSRVRAEAGRALQLLMAGQGYEAAALLDEIGTEPADEPQVDLRAGQLAEQRHTFLDLDPDSACCPPGFTCPAAHTAPELEATA